MIQTTTLPPLAQPIISAVAVGYFAVVAAIGIWATRKTRTASDFFVAGQGIGLWALAIASTVTVCQRVWVVRKQALAEAALRSPHE